MEKRKIENENENEMDEKCWMLDDVTSKLWIKPPSNG
jgi:hypothetical protein